MSRSRDRACLSMTDIRSSGEAGLGGIVVTPREFQQLLFQIGCDLLTQVFADVVR